MRYITIFFLLGFLSCGTESQDDLITGDLYFSVLRIGSYYNLDDSLKKRFEFMLDTVELERADSNALKLIDAYESLKQEGLLYKPFVDLKTGDDSFIKLYLDSADYDRLKIHKQQSLRQEGKKVVVKTRAREIKNMEFPLFYCEELIDINVVDGETLPVRSKFKIEDYQ